MAARSTTFKGTPLTLAGREVKSGDQMPNFRLTGTDLKDITNETFAGSTLIISSVPSIDTPVCSIETKRFNQEAGAVPSVKVLTVSMDLPFAQQRWCATEGAASITMGSDYKYRSFGEDFGTYIQELGLLSRAVFVVDPKGTVRYVQYVPEIADEPDYDSVLAAARQASGKTCCCCGN